MAYSMSIRQEIFNRGGGAKGRDIDREDKNKTPFVVLARRENERRILLRVNKKSFGGGRQPI